ncbi:Undecaprenyl-diphosphatase, partial [Clarias magur]
TSLPPGFKRAAVTVENRWVENAKVLVMDISRRVDQSGAVLNVGKRERLSAV